MQTCNNTRVKQLLAVQKEAKELFERKNTDYGDAFADYGMVGVLVRLGDKVRRYQSISNKGVNVVNDEAMRDTLIDLHNYAAMAIMLYDEKEKGEEENTQKSNQSISAPSFVDIAIEQPMKTYQKEENVSEVDDLKARLLEARLECEEALKTMASAREEVELELEETKASLTVGVEICEKLKSELNEKEEKSNENSIKECLWHPV
jgi:hypothetical protein